ncbi:MAG: T9SS C-terminal target domain-containing protein [Chitinophagia bacterium]|nr:T9SS C-terminal target domain-containing protein [Chitinophagia bacterium]
MPIRIFMCLCTTLLYAGMTQAQPIPGCTDRAANNFNAAATANNGTCTYDAITLTPTLKFLHNDTLNENSGTVYWNSWLWHHNDNGGPFPSHLFATDTATRTIRRMIVLGTALSYLPQVDWEDIAQDDTHLYVGDFGNNVNGARTDLKIYKLAKSAISPTSDNVFVTPEVISFRYPDQAVSPTPVAVNTTDFDCEAMVAYNGRLYLFTKQYTGGQTALYELPNTAGTHVATKLATLNINGLITGADILPDRRVIVLTGYTLTQQRFAYLLYDFTGNAFFGGNKRRIGLQGIAQTEAVAFLNNNRIVMGSEKAASFPAQMEALDLSGLLKDYYALVPLANIKKEMEDILVSCRNGWMTVTQKTGQKTQASIYTSDGRLCRKVTLTAARTDLPVSGLSAGTYVLRASRAGKMQALRFVIGN